MRSGVRSPLAPPSTQRRIHPDNLATNLLRSDVLFNLFAILRQPFDRLALPLIGCVESI
jgi:hypothetical protein